MARILVLERDPEQVGPNERQAVACATRTAVDELEFVRIDPADAAEHVGVTWAHGPHPRCVLLSRMEQEALVMDAVKTGVPHFAFMDDRQGDSNFGRRLYMLLPNGHFILCRRQGY